MIFRTFFVDQVYFPGRHIPDWDIYYIFGRIMPTCFFGTESNAKVFFYQGEHGFNLIAYTGNHIWYILLMQRCQVKTWKWKVWGRTDNMLILQGIYGFLPECCKRLLVVCNNILFICTSDWHVYVSGCPFCYLHAHSGYDLPGTEIGKGPQTG